MESFGQSDMMKGKGGPLAINRSSSKISKQIRRPVIPPKSAPMIYNTDPMSFRNLVQELTGSTSCSASAPVPAAVSVPASAVAHVPPSAPVPAPASAPPQVAMPAPVSAPPPPVAKASITTSTLAQQSRPTLPPVSGSKVVTPAPSVARPVNLRLQKMAPPPLKPKTPAVVLADSNSGAMINNKSFATLSPMSKRVSSMPNLSFSPLPALTPGDNVWANFASPNTAAINELAQSLVGKEINSSKDASDPQAETLSPWSPTPLSPWSPNLQSILSFLSPGIPQNTSLQSEIKELPEVSMDDADFSFHIG